MLPLFFNLKLKIIETMKKIILSALVVGSLLATSCKKEKEEAKNTTEKTVEATADATKKAVETTADATKKAVETTTDAANEAVKEAENAVNKAAGTIASALDGVSIPDFENDKVEQHLKDYATYAKDYIDSKGDVLKNASLAKKGIALTNEAKGLVSNLSTDDLKKYKDVMTAIQSKMAPAK